MTKRRWGIWSQKDIDLCDATTKALMRGMTKESIRILNKRKGMNSPLLKIAKKLQKKS